MLPPCKMSLFSQFESSLLIRILGIMNVLCEIIELSFLLLFYVNKLNYLETVVNIYYFE